MKLEEIIEKVKHDLTYFEKAETEFQAGRAWEAGKILDMLYLMKQAQLQQPVVVRGGDKVRESVQRVEEYLEWLKGNDTPNTPTEPLPAEGLAKGVCGGDCTCENVTDMWECTKQCYKPKN